MRHIIVLAALAAVLLPGTALARQQVLHNGSFELTSVDPNDPNIVLVDDWTRFGGADQSSDYAFAGDFSALASLRVNGFVGMYQDPVEVRENTRVVMQALTYIPSSAPLPAGGPVAGIKLEFRVPSGIEVPPPEENLAFDANSPMDTWVPVSLSTEVPPDVNIAKVIMISFDRSSENGAVYCDSAYAALGSAPGMNQLLNASFELGSSSPNGLTNWTEFADPASYARKLIFQNAHDGAFVLAMMGPATSGVTQQFPVTAGDTLDVSAFFRQSSTDPYADPNAQAGVKVEWVAGSVPTPNIDIAPNANPISGTTNIVDSSAPNDQWVPVTIDYTMPAGSAALLRATLISGFGPAESDIYFDAFEMVLTNVFVGSDSDGDNDQDMKDIQLLQQVFTGPDGAMKYGGIVFDHDENGHVDFDDVNTDILPNQTGPAIEEPEL